MNHPQGSAPPRTWTVRRLLEWIGSALSTNGIDSPRLCAEMLIADVLGCERLRLYMDADREVEAPQLDRLRALVARALQHEPIQYLTGEAWFFGMPMLVDPRVLIPRPSTETIVEEVLQAERRKRTAAAPADEGREAPAPDGQAPQPTRAASSVEPSIRIADVCTGSGCIAAALARHLRSATVIATDLSGEAVECARANMARHAVASRVELRQGDLLAPLAGEAGTLDYLVSNPPYIPDHQWDAVERNVKDFEPHGALRGGPDGLQFVAPIIAGAPGLLAPGGALLIEVAACAAGAGAELARAAGLSEVRVLKDGDGLERVVTGRKAC